MMTRKHQFSISDLVYMKFLTIKGVMIYFTKENISPRYGIPYKILGYFDNIDYEFDLPVDLASLHLIFYVSVLKKCIVYSSLIMILYSIGVKYSFSY